MSGNRKYLPFSRAGLALPCLTSRENKAIPGWSIILDKALEKLSSGYADLQLVRKHLAKLGLISLSALFDNYITISNLLSNDDISPNASKRKDVGKTTNQKKQVRKTQQKHGQQPQAKQFIFQKQIHHGEFHNQPDPPANLNLQPPAITKGIGAKWPNHNLIGSSLITSNAKRNSLDTISLIKSPISNNEISSRNPRLY